MLSRWIVYLSFLGWALSSKKEGLKCEFFYFPLCKIFFWPNHWGNRFFQKCRNEKNEIKSLSTCLTSTLFCCGLQLRFSQSVWECHLFYSTLVTRMTDFVVDMSKIVYMKKVRKYPLYRWQKLSRIKVLSTHFWNYITTLASKCLSLKFFVLIKSSWPITTTLIEDILDFTTRRGVLVSYGFFLFFLFFSSFWPLGHFHWRRFIGGRDFVSHIIQTLFTDHSHIHLQLKKRVTTNWKREKDNARNEYVIYDL